MERGVFRGSFRYYLLILVFIVADSSIGWGIADNAGKGGNQWGK